MDLIFCKLKETKKTGISFFVRLTPNLIQRETGFFEVQTRFEPSTSQKSNR